MADDADNETWVDVLAGRRASGPNQHAAREARLLRESLLRRWQLQSADQPAQLPARDARREAQLLARAQREGLIDPAQLQQRSRWLRGGRAAVTLAAAAAIACVAIGLSVFLRTGTPQEIYRGTPEGVVSVEAANPTALKGELIMELRAAGVAATGYERFGIQGIDAELPRPVSSRVREVLEKHHLPVPADGVLKVEITAPEPR